MLIEFSVSNFRSFKEEQTLSLVASADRTHEGNLIRGEQLNLLKAAGVYGANASGKSNLLRGIGAMEWFVVNSATKMNQGDSIPRMSPFRLASETAAQPSYFEVVVVLDGIRYRYGFTATAERVYDEWLFVCPRGKKPRQWIEREFDPETKETEWNLKYDIKVDKKMLIGKTRENGLVLSRGAELNVKALGPLYRWFVERLWIFTLAGQRAVLAQVAAQRVEGDDGLRNRVTQLLQHADVGIVDLKLEKKPFVLDDIPPAIRETMPQEVAAHFQGMSVIDIRSMHNVVGQEAPVEFDFEDESDGTQRLFALAALMLDALDKGATVVVDELECSMHPLLTRKLIEVFQNPEMNSKGAQLVFATHDTTLMDQALFRRDQLWLTEKNPSGATGLFSLYDFKHKPRNNEAFERRYLAGRYGAVPQFGPALEDAKLE